jgi:hypothetical protein
MPFEFLAIHDVQNACAQKAIFPTSRLVSAEGKSKLLAPRRE